jgi:hypothetical protein
MALSAQSNANSFSFLGINCDRVFAGRQIGPAALYAVRQREVTLVVYGDLSRDATARLRQRPRIASFVMIGIDLGLRIGSRTSDCKYERQTDAARYQL